MVKWEGGRFSWLETKNLRFMMINLFTFFSDNTPNMNTNESDLHRKDTRTPLF